MSQSVAPTDSQLSTARQCWPSFNLTHDREGYWNPKTGEFIYLTEDGDWELLTPKNK